MSTTFIKLKDITLTISMFSLICKFKEDPIKRYQAMQQTRLIIGVCVFGGEEVGGGGGGHNWRIMVVFNTHLC